MDIGIKTIRNAQAMIEAGVESAILFGANKDVSSIPVITIEKPIPGAGLVLGRPMATEFSATPMRRPDEIGLLCYQKVGSIVYSRVTGAESGFVERGGEGRPPRVVPLNEKGSFARLCGQPVTILLRPPSWLIGV